jgi:hypothetical protein
VRKIGQQVSGRAPLNRRLVITICDGLFLIATQSETEALVTYRKQRTGPLSNRYTRGTCPKADR